MEGSAARAWSANTTFVVAPSAGDFRPGGDDYWGGDTVAGGPYDQEFDRGPLTSALPTGWSWVNQGAATFTEEFGTGRVAIVTDAAQATRGIFRAAPAQALSYTATAKIRAQTNLIQFAGWGLLIRDSATGRIGTLGVYIGAADYVNAMSLTSATVFGGNTDMVSSVTLSTARWGLPTYFRMAKTGTSIQFSYSFDGIFWWVIGAGTQWPGTIDQIGFGFYSYGAGVTGAVQCDWLRIR